jgi:hypothetical protein
MPSSSPFSIVSAKYDQRPKKMDIDAYGDFLSTTTSANVKRAGMASLGMKKNRTKLP